MTVTQWNSHTECNIQKCAMTRREKGSHHHNHYNKSIEFFFAFFLVYFFIHKFTCFIIIILSSFSLLFFIIFTYTIFVRPLRAAYNDPFSSHFSIQRFCCMQLCNNIRLRVEKRRPTIFLLSFANIFFESRKRISYFFSYT